MRQTFLIIFIPFLTVSCNLADDERCGKGLVWDDEVELCRKAENQTDDDDDSESEIALDTSTEPVTFGTHCFDLEDCSDTVDFCLLNPIAPDDPGICTIENCESGDCPANYQCCDCTRWGQSISCMPDEGAESAVASGCTCS